MSGMNTAVVETEHYRAVFKNTIRNNLAFASLIEEWVQDGSDNVGMRNQFAYIICHLHEWQGDVWQPPKKRTNTVLNDALGIFENTFNLKQMREMADAIDNLYDPVANVLEKHDEHLTEAEAADPN